MRNLLTITFILILTSCNGQDYKIEKQLLECQVSSAKTFGVDLKKEFNEFESYLIDSKILKDKRGDSYYQIYKQIEKEGDANFYFNYSLLDTIRLHSNSTGLQGIQTECSDYFEKILNSKDYKKSKLYTLNLAMDSIKKAGDINVSEIAKTITKVLTPKDFEQDYYKMTLMLTLVATQEVSSGLVRRLPPAPEDVDKTSIKERNLVHIHVTNNSDSVFFNSRAISTYDLPQLTKDYILSDKSDTLKPELRFTNIENIGECYQSELIISLSNDKETKYDTYIKVQNQLLKAYELARNDMSKKYFKRQFNDLTDSEKKAIKELVPLRISEAEPER